MIGLVEPLAAVSDKVIPNQRWVALQGFLCRVDDTLAAGLAANVVTVAAALGMTMALKFLHSKYQRG